MKQLKKMGFISLILLLLVTMLVPATSMAAAQPTVNLGTTSSYAVLAGSTITNTGTTTINGSAGGDIGLFPGTAFTGQASATISGTVHLADAAAILAKTDLIIAYDDADGRLPVTRINSELGGTTLIPGTYDSADGTFQITGTLTLDAQGDPDGVFVFKTASTLITASDSIVNLINEARFCRTFWKVGSSATLGTNSHFVGHIFAMESITATTGASVQGQLMARNGAVTLDTNTITNGICAIIPAPATLHVIKHVINDSGRTAVAADFNLHVKTSGIDVAASPSHGVEAPGTTYTLAAGTYVVSEDPVAGYTRSFSGDSTDGNIVLAPGDDKTIIVTNNDNPAPPSPVVYPPLINVVKTPAPLALTSGQGSVTYTYRVTNPGKVALSNVSVSDNKVSTVKYVSGDINADSLLQPSETWVYTSQMILKATTTNTATAKGTANGMTATDIAIATVVVTTPVVVVPTVAGGQLPKTGTPWYNLLLAGAALALIGAVGWRTRKIYE